MEANKLVIFVFKILAEPAGQEVWLTTNSIKVVLHFEDKNIKIQGMYFNEVQNMRNGIRI